MKPICPFCGHQQVPDVPRGQVYKCPQCHEFFRVGEDESVSEHQDSNINEYPIPSDASSSEPIVLTPSGGQSTAANTVTSMKVDAKSQLKLPVVTGYVLVAIYSLTALWFHVELRLNPHVSKNKFLCFAVIGIVLLTLYLTPVLFYKKRITGSVSVEFDVVLMLMFLGLIGPSSWVAGMLFHDSVVSWCTEAKMVGSSSLSSHRADYVAYEGKEFNLYLQTSGQFLQGILAQRGSGVFTFAEISDPNSIDKPLPYNTPAAGPVESATWGTEILKVPQDGPWKHRRVTLHVKMRIPFKIKRFTNVKGFFEMPATYPVPTGGGYFQNVDAKVRSVPCELTLVPTEVIEKFKVFRDDKETHCISFLCWWTVICSFTALCLLKLSQIRT